jgi:uncharacterized protein YjbJ (UPF0337 family)
MTNDKLEGKAKEIVGEGKERLGEATGDEEMEAEGTADKLEGKGQGMVGKAKDALDDIKRKAS